MLIKIPANCLSDIIRGGVPGADGNCVLVGVNVRKMEVVEIYSCTC